jgi:hypothetical protein
MSERRMRRREKRMSKMETTRKERTTLTWRCGNISQVVSANTAMSTWMMLTGF